MHPNSLDNHWSSDAAGGGGLEGAEAATAEMLELELEVEELELRDRLLPACRRCLSPCE